MSVLGLPVLAEMTHSLFQLYGGSLGGLLAFSEEGSADRFRTFLASEETRALRSVRGFLRASKIHSWDRRIRSSRQRVKRILDVTNGNRNYLFAGYLRSLERPSLCFKAVRVVDSFFSRNPARGARPSSAIEYSW